MKKEVQALIKRRRARVIPAILLAIAGIIVIGIALLVVAAMTNGPGLGLVRTATPSPSLTPSQTATPTTPAPTDTPEATATETVTAGPSPTATPLVHVIESGETLFSIAELYGANVCLIMAVNNITDPALLVVGTSLVIPPDDVELPTATPLPTDLAPRTRLPYVVQCGDTLVSIAAKFNSTAEDIAEINEIESDQDLFIGQVIEVRVNLATPTPTATGTNTPPGGATTGTPPAPASTLPAPATATRSP
jgi:LysM repeat protein